MAEWWMWVDGEIWEESSDLGGRDDGHRALLQQVRWWMGVIQQATADDNSTGVSHALIERVCAGKYRAKS